MSRRLVRRSLYRFVCGALLLPVAGIAAAAGMNCGRAVSPTETAICASDTLRRLDAQLGALYGRFATALPAQRGALKQTQTAWLASRDRCGSDASCLEARYRERFAALGRQLVDGVAYRPDDTDRQALDDLRAAVEAARATNPVTPLDDAIARFVIRNGTTEFANVNDGDNDGSNDDDAHFPTHRPDGVTADEWRALVASKIDGGGEHGNSHYTLMDIDGDGKRDLIVDTYTGGTGLFSNVSVLKRVGDRFVDPNPVVAPVGQGDDGMGFVDPSLYSINGRGADQRADWIRLRGRVYAAWRNGEYGADHVYLLRPLTIVGNVPILTVGYRYTLSIPKQQTNDAKGKPTVLDDALHASLEHALGSIDRERAHDTPQGADSGGKPLCPVPATVKDDERDAYYTYGPGHYSYEIVGDMPVWIGQRCYIGRLVDWFGRYDAKTGGLGAQLWVHAPGDDAHDREQDYDVDGVRTTVRVGTSVGKVENNNS